eukprot:337632_1
MSGSKECSTLLSQADKCREILKQYFGFNSYRQSQLEIILHTINGGDSLVVMATGSGKSICYQIPALYSQKKGLIISPLLSLIFNQQSALLRVGIKSVQLKNGGIMKALADPSCSFVFTTPESLSVHQDLIQTINSKYGFSCVAIDEAHCVDEWGHNFRPTYKQLHVLKKLLPNVPMIALTATATPIVQQKIIASLKLGDGNNKLLQFINSFKRKNLFYKVTTKKSSELDLCSTDSQKYYSAGSTIIYCRSRADCDRIADELKQHQMTTVAAYHKGIEFTKRFEIQSNWENDKIQCIVATIAFGMGIDKPNIRYVIHYGVPSSMDAYYQQIGRAGRDGKVSHCIMFWNKNDIKKLNILNKNVQSTEILRQYCEGKCCRVQFILHYFGENAEDCVDYCDICIDKYSKIVYEDVDAETNLDDETKDSLDDDINGLIAFDNTIKKKIKIYNEILSDIDKLDGLLDSTETMLKQFKSIEQIIPANISTNKLTESDKTRILQIYNGSKKIYSYPLESFVLDISKANQKTTKTILQFDHAQKKGYFMCLSETNSTQSKEDNNCDIHEKYSNNSNINNAGVNINVNINCAFDTNNRNPQNINNNNRAGTTGWEFNPHYDFTEGKISYYQHICVGNDNFEYKSTEELRFADQFSKYGPIINLMPINANNNSNNEQCVSHINNNDSADSLSEHESDDDPNFVSELPSHELVRQYQERQQQLSVQNSENTNSNNRTNDVGSFLPQLNVSFDESEMKRDESSQAFKHYMPSMNQNTLMDSSFVAMPPDNSRKQIINVNIHNNNSLIDFDEINKVRQQIENDKHERNTIDPSISTLDKTLYNCEWRKYNRKLKRDIVRWIAVRIIIVTGGKVKGYWKEMEDDILHNVTKSWLVDLKHHLHVLFLQFFFELEYHECGKKREETLNILYRKLNLTSKNVKIIDVVMKQVFKICQYMQTFNEYDISSLIHESMLQDDILSDPELGLVSIFEFMETEKSFVKLEQTLWRYMICCMKEAKDMSQFNDKYRAMVKWWNDPNRVQRIANWTKIDCQIKELQKIYDTNIDEHLQYFWNFDEFITNLMTVIKETFVEQTRRTIKRGMWIAGPGQSIIISRVYLFNVSGAGLCATYRHVERVQNGLFLPAVDKISCSNKNDLRYPQLFREEDDGKWKFMIIELEHVIKLSLQDLHKEIALLFKFSSNPDIDTVIDRIITRRDIQVEFQTIYSGYKCEDLYDNKIVEKMMQKGKQIVVSEKEKIIQYIYRIFMNFVLSKAAYKFIRSKDYNKTFIPLRIQKKFESMNKKK